MRDVVLVSDPEAPVHGLCHVLQARPVEKVVLPQIVSPGHQVGLCRQLLLAQKCRGLNLSALPSPG